ncbi:CrcB family protein, partial [Candidatus Bipolaricaulota bacterium]|nr:CrcB family protein [Candidatus Bipolaricaulota bacterium]
LGTTFPWGTLLVNLTGSFLIGFLWESFDYAPISPDARTFIFIGMLGAFTTFSTYAFETVSLLKDKEFFVAAVNIFANNLLGICLCLAGFFSARLLFNSPG